MFAHFVVLAPGNIMAPNQRFLLQDNSSNNLKKMKANIAVVHKNMKKHDGDLEAKVNEF